MSQKQDMNNAAYDEKYLSRLREQDKYFIDSNFSRERTITLSDNITVIINDYSAGDQNTCYLDGAEVYFVFRGKEIYKYRCYYKQGAFYKLIHHSNGNDYILFRRDLYGYSVLELSTLKDFHYYPACHLEPEGDETFIWCDPIYNPNNNLMAVYGCYWACPFDLALVDFTEPFSPAENQVCILFKKDIGDILDKTGSYSWSGSDLIIRSKHSKCLKEREVGVAYSYNDLKDFMIIRYKTHKITEVLCRKWLSEGNGI